MTRVFAAISLAALLLVVDSTGLKGSWDFDITWTPQFLLPMAGSDSVTLFDALNKQLGLKLEEQKLPSPVIVVDQVNRAPTDNPPDIQAKLPPLPPAEFEVADIKPTMPGARPPEGRFGFLPGGRVNLPGFPLRAAISLAWNLLPLEEIVGAPKWLDSARFDIIAKAPAAIAPASGALAGMRGAPPPGLPGEAPVAASDPVGGISLFDAIEKQLGLKLEAQKRSYPVFVIDHIEEKPTDN